MEIKDIRDVVIDQRNDMNRYLKSEKVIKRSVLRDYEKSVLSPLIKVILGVRRCGKSTLAFQLLEGKEFAYINFDDERLIGLEKEDLNKVLEGFYEIYGKLGFILLDEVQNVYGWELFVNRLKRKGFNVIVTGSNARLLSKELATHLTGRHVSFELFPFSFKEFLRYHGIKFNLNLLSTEERGLIKNKLNDYLENGGFPERLRENVDVKQYLRSLYSTILEKDVIVRNKIRYVKSLREISNYLISNYSSSMSFNKIKNIFNIKSVHTVINYISFLEEAYLFFFLRRFSYKEKEQIIANRKVYVIDSGLINAISFKSFENLGRLYENVVALELMRRKSLGREEIYYWQDYQKREVDFVVKEGFKVKELIQVCHKIRDNETRERELRNLIIASKELKCKDLLVITEDKEGEEEIEWFGVKRRVRYAPLWKWLLKEDRNI